MLEKKQSACAAIIVAAGKGLRFDADQRKQFSSVRGVPLIAWTISAFDRADSIREIVLVVPHEEILKVSDEIVVPFRWSKKISVVEGGERRQDSVQCGLQSVKDRAEFAAVHDGVRPAISTETIEMTCIKAFEAGGALCAIPSTDSTFRSSGEDIENYLDRTELWQAQTPQVFKVCDLIAAFEKFKRSSFSDEGVLMKTAGHSVSVVKGDAANIKLTYKSDLILLEDILSSRERPE